MTLLRNPAFWVLFWAVSLFWASDYALGTAANRDVIDLVSMAFSFVMGCRLMTDAWDRFNRGGGQRNWQLLMSNFLLAWGWFCFCGWTFLSRSFRQTYEMAQDAYATSGLAADHAAMQGAYETYQWMINSPMNGFFKFWLLGGFVLSYFATSEVPTPLAPTRLYYIGIGVAFGVLGGFIAARFIPI